MASIRKASVDDIPQIMQLAAKAFPATYREILSSEQITFMMELMYSEQSLTHQMTTGNNIFHICDGKGYASYRYEGRDDDGTEHFHLEKLYVIPECQGQGLGRALFDSVADAARGLSAGAVRIELNVNRYNRAVSFYEHIGMHRDRQGDFPIGKNFFMNDYIMAIEWPAGEKR